MSEIHELQPYVLYVAEAGQMRCALWRLEEGRQALAIFRSEEAAAQYRAAAGLEGWQTYQPQPDDLLEIFAQSYESGVELAVLDPDGQRAMRIFLLRDVLASQGRRP